MPRVSVVIPTFNREHLIKRAIESVFNQTYSDLEIIVCDDGSKDKTVEVVKSMIDHATVPLRLEVLPQNLGVSAARNWGVFCAQGELVAFLDSDDTWKPEKLEKQVKFLDAGPAHVGVGCGISFISESNGKVTRENPSHHFTENNELFKIINDCYITTSCFLVKKDALILSGMFDIRLKSSEDRDLWWRLPRFGRIGYINEPLIYYMVHEESLSYEFSSATAKTYLPALMKTVWYWRDKLSKEQIKEIMANSYMLFAIDSSCAGNNIQSIGYTFKSIMHGGSLIKGIRFALSELLKFIKLK